MKVIVVVCCCLSTPKFCLPVASPLWWILPKSLHWLTIYDSHMNVQSSILAREHLLQLISSSSYLLLWYWLWEILDVVLITGIWTPIRFRGLAAHVCMHVSVCYAVMYVWLLKYLLHKCMCVYIMLYELPLPLPQITDIMCFQLIVYSIVLHYC